MDELTNDSSIKDIAEKFLKEEKLSLQDALVFGSLGLSNAIGDIAEIAYGVKFSEHPYDDERRGDMAEFLGNALLYWHILAITSGFAGQEIVKGWVSSWLIKNNVKMSEEISIKELLSHLKINSKLKEMTLHSRDQERTREK
jgi:hypothetical protein